MREKVKDKGRLEHILQACTTLLEYKDKYDFETAKGDPRHILWVCETC